MLNKLIKYSFSNVRATRVKYVLHTTTTSFTLNHLRSALTAFYFARTKGGSFILHLDDIKEQESHSDFKDNYVGYLHECMNWDEGYGNQFNEEGKYGPYQASQKMERYNQVAEQLIKEGKAYRCFCDKNMTKTQNEQVYKNNKIPVYNGTCRNLSEKQIEEKLQNKVDYSIRLKTDFKNDPYKKIQFEDGIQSNAFIYQAYLQDMVIIKSNGQPSKFFMYSIDDMDQNISHVIRQVDWMRDVPKQQAMYKALNYQNPPQFYHLPHMLDGQGKYFKNEDLFKYYQIKDLMRDGYTIQALANFAITQIWRKKMVDEKIEEAKKQTKNVDLHHACEIYSTDYLQTNFSIDDIKPQAYYYDQAKLNSFNKHFIRQKYLPLFEEECDQQLSDKLIKEFREILLKELGPQFKESIDKTKDKNIVQIIEIVTNRIRTLRDLKSYPFFFVDPTYDTDRERKSRELIFNDPAINKKYVQVVKDMINIYNKKIPDSQFHDSSINKNVIDYFNNVNTKLDKDIQFKFMRFVLTGYHQSHSIGFVSQIIGKAACLRRLRTMAKLLEDIPQSS